ncbi:MAG: hypothetical protein IT184_03045 [Acidobacteria bacterium]|nr:hypothetical protein [Acidobacteriota bacterium]
MEVWVEPVIEWQARSDSEAQHRALAASGERLARWPPAPSDDGPTDCFRLGQEFWIWQTALGGLRFSPDHPSCSAFPSIDVDRSWFEHVVTRSWLPAVYQVWGRQVLHASAAVHVETGDVVAFAGPSGAGKSTLAYGLGTMAGWRPLTDDTLAFSVIDGRIHLHPLPNHVRLRPASAEHFGVRNDVASRVLAWPEGPLALACVYFLEPHEADGPLAERDALRAGESYPQLLGQAHAFTLELPDQNQRLMRDYLTLAASVPIARLRYRRGFADLERVLDVVARAEAARRAVR